ncbi:O-antigen polymerase [Plantactinospora soyae]|uniref:O-antigen polysaccharide polymerase Wzy n=1 Tax=Plantactinospora soyae TaxID=1544732 RepID=A0A927M655_9ACTN|nr:O-antigen polymerase [Plantactinospora soyae]MBE1488722.1 hypothetical protein [Plantactinospora soyae]
MTRTPYLASTTPANRATPTTEPVPDGGAPSDTTPARIALIGPGLGAEAASWAMSALLVTSASTILALLDPRLRHWFLIPVTVCGVLIGIDAVEWVRRRRDIFDPQAILGLLGMHFFYLAPILNVMLDHWPRHLVGPPDWRAALGTMALLNVLGLCLYRVVLGFRDRPPPRTRRASRFDERAFYRVGLVAVLVSVLAFCGEVVMFGGISGYLSTMTGESDRVELAGLGWLLILGEAFPMIVFALVLVRWRSWLAEHRWAILLLLVGLALMQFFVGGLRGSRSNTIWPVLIGLTLIHLLVVRVSRRAMFVFILVLGLFVYTYGLYKSAGLEVLDAARGTRSVEDISSETGRDVPSLLLGDLSRADIQALVLDRQLRGNSELAYGVTYLGDVSFLVPGAVLPERPRDKVAAGTDLLFGPGAYESGIRASRVYGLTGEAIMNFGPAGGVVSFALLGVLVRFSRRHYARARQQRSISTTLLAPMALVCAFLPTADLDNNTWFLLKYVLPLAAVVWLARQGRSASRALRSGPPTESPRTARTRPVPAAEAWPLPDLSRR